MAMLEAWKKYQQEHGGAGIEVTFSKPKPISIDGGSIDDDGAALLLPGRKERRDTAEWDEAEELRAQQDMIKKVGAGVKEQQKQQEAAEQAQRNKYAGAELLAIIVSRTQRRTTML